MLLIELNEFSVQFLTEASAHQSTPAIDRVLSWRHCITESEEKEERYGLDPWVQWVSIHTGRPASEHGIAHLGEIDCLQHEQIWDELNAKGISSVIWGPMNGKNNQHPLMSAFFPDPWAFQETAAPNQLNGLLALPRLYAQDYIQPNIWQLARSGLRTCSFLLRHHVKLVLQNLGVWVRPVLTAGINNAILFALFDNLSSKIFRRYCAVGGSEFKLVFFNSIAHLQHHDWHPKSRKVQAVIKLLEDTLATALSAADINEPVIVANAFSQTYSADENEFLYRPVDPQGLLREFGLTYSRIEQMMTNDGHVFFESPADCKAAREALSGAAVSGSKAFDVDERDDTRLFYQFRIWDEIDEDATLEINGRSLKFYSLFEKVVRRTGSHVPTGDVFYRNLELPDRMKNHDLFHHLKGQYV